MSSSNNNSGSRVLVTGVTGFVGSHTVKQLLDADYNVRAIVRKGKTSKFLKMFPDYPESRLDVVEILDLVDSDFTDALKDVNAVLHIAAPVFGGDTTGEEIFKGALYGTVNIVEQAAKAGIPKIVVTSTQATLMNDDMKTGFDTEPFTADSWNNATINDIKPSEQHPAIVYFNTKAVSERKVWEIAERYPAIDFTTLLPPAIYGAFLPGFPAPARKDGLGTAYYPYALIAGSEDNNGIWPAMAVGSTIDVKDVARAHVLALKAPALQDGRRKRLLISSGEYTWKEMAEHIRKTRPDLADRLPRTGTPVKQTIAPMDTSFTKEVLGLDKYVPWTESILDNLDSCLIWEKTGQF